MGRVIAVPWSVCRLALAQRQALRVSCESRPPESRLNTKDGNCGQFIPRPAKNISGCDVEYAVPALRLPHARNMFAMSSGSTDTSPLLLSEPIMFKTCFVSIAVTTLTFVAASSFVAHDREMIIALRIALPTHRCKTTSNC
jgi:hypothetical protein